MQRILIVEDNEDLAFGLLTNLEIEGYQVDIAVTGGAGLAKIKSWRPDLVILDLMLPELDGFAVLKALRGFRPRPRLLILSARGEEIDKVRGLRLGADDYVSKPFGLMELLARVEALLRRERSPPAAPPCYRLGEITIEPDSRTVQRGEQQVALSPKEFDLLLELVRRDGAVVSRVELMQCVWGHSSAVVSRTVDTHIAELRRKLEADPARPALILTVRKAGYRALTAASS